SVHTLLTGERTGYYADFGTVHPLGKTLKNGWFYSGQYSRHRQRRHGNCPKGFARERFVVCCQNHDQVGNRARGERLSALVDFEGLKLAAGITALCSFTPLLFMGEEYGETSAFQYFTSHGDPELGEAVRRGRERDFVSFRWQGGVPDPQAESTFAASKLKHSLGEHEPHGTLWRFYQMLLRYRRGRHMARATQTVTEYQNAVLVEHQTENRCWASLFHFGASAARFPLLIPAGQWTVAIDSADVAWRGPGGPPLPKVFEGANVRQVLMPPRSLGGLESAASRRCLCRAPRAARIPSRPPTARASHRR